MDIDSLVKEKHILVTGGSQGLGKSICLELAAKGATISFTYNRSEQKAKETLKELNLLTKADMYKVSVDDSKATEELISSIVKNMAD